MKKEKWFHNYASNKVYKFVIMRTNNFSFTKIIVNNEKRDSKGVFDQIFSFSKQINCFDMKMCDRIVGQVL